MFAKCREMVRRVRAPGFPAVLAVMAVLVSGLLTSASAQTSLEKYRAQRAAQSPFNLAAGANTTLQANLIQCGIDNVGNVCANVFNSPTGGGGFWPAGTTNQYIFNSGTQIAGINASNAGPWAGDTTGAYFFDARGTQAQGSQLTQVFSSLDPNDIANWPAGAVVTDTSLFNAALIGQNAISDQDTWVQYWDGDPNKIAAKKHPMGIKVEQRSLAFNSPAGAENMLFFIYKLTNVTNDPTFQQLNNAKFAITLPAAGFTIDSVYADFAMDPDVSANNATDNFSNAVLPFNLGFAYESHFEATDFNFASHASVYAPPFLVAPGFIGVKFLRSPINPATGQQVGLTLFTNFTNGGAFPDPTGVKQLWRFLSGNINGAAGDPPCNVPNVKQARLCYLAQEPADTRFLQASGPFSLKAGQSVTIVVAYVNAAAVGANGYQAGTIVRPGIASTTPGANGQPIRQIEAMTGWVSTPPAAIRADGSIDESKVVVVKNSLLDMARIAQAIFNNKFLLPRPPAVPQFTLIPGNNQVTIVWTPSPTETQGDPYFKIASDSTSALFNPNYRQFDVQGYRILRSTGVSGGYDVIAQFDKKGTFFNDFTGEFDPNYVPETMGDYETFANNTYGEYPVPVPLTGAVVEFPSGGRIQDAATGAVIITRADTINLKANGVPFAFVDNAVKNGITYRYLVQAFDVNSLASGSLSLTSPAQPQNVVPRETNLTAGNFTLQMQGPDAVKLDPTGATTIDPDKGTLSAIPPTNGFQVAVEPFIPELATTAGKTTVQIDSVHAGSPEAGFPATYYLTASGGGGTQKIQLPLAISATGTSADVQNKAEISFAATKPDASFAAKYGLQNANQPGLITLLAPDAYYMGVRIRGWVNGAEGNYTYSGPQWFVSGSAITPDPNIGQGYWWCVNGDGVAPDQCGSDTGTKFGAPMAGSITGYDIFNVKSYSTVTSRLRSLEAVLSTVYRAADVEITWGANGAVTSVKDLSNHVDVPFGQGYGASWGFLTPASFANVTASSTYDKSNTFISPSDFNCVEPFRTYAASGLTGFVDCSGSSAPAVLQNTATISQVDTAYGGKGGSTDAGTGATGRPGFALYLSGELFMFFPSNGQLPASGTKWTLRTYTGFVDGTPVLDADGHVTDVKGYTITEAVRPPNVPGLQAVINVSPTTAVTSVAQADLNNIHTVPDPYYVRSQFDLGPSTKQLRFVNLPSQALIRIFSVNGILVQVIEHNDPLLGGEEAWNLRNRNNQFVASGVYFYVVEAAGGIKKTGRFTVIQFAR